MTDFPRLTDGRGREYVLRRRPGEDDDVYRRRAADHARLGIRYESVDQSLEQVVFIEADRRILMSNVEALRRQLSAAEYELQRAIRFLDRTD